MGTANHSSPTLCAFRPTLANYRPDPEPCVRILGVTDSKQAA